MDHSLFTAERLRVAAPMLFAVARREKSREMVRRRLAAMAQEMEFDTFYDYGCFREGSIMRVRDCAQVFRSIITKRSEDLAKFSVVRAIRDIALDRPRPDLSPAFYAEMIHLLLGLQGVGPGKAPGDDRIRIDALEGREAAQVRSRQLDALWEGVSKPLESLPWGLDEDMIRRRVERRRRVLDVLGGTGDDWRSWTWQVRHAVKDPDLLARLVTLSPAEKRAVKAAVERRIPFGVTPYYLSLMDEEPTDADRAVRAQVIPTLEYVERTAAGRAGGESSLDFMLEEDTSPVDLVTRRYPAIVVLKPYNTCPQICVYCQRNWEIKGVLEPGAYAGRRRIEEALRWIEERPAICEVLVTGGDPLALSDSRLEMILEGIARIPTIERIRIGTRTFANLPMRFTPELCRLLGRFREPGRRDVAVVTHVQSPYEITPELVEAVEGIRGQGISVLNQLVYTFFVSRRFEAAGLRRRLSRAGIEPYYTFNMKGKDETDAFRVPLARLMQEQKEEARLLPGLARTDEAVYNLPGLGKNYLRANRSRNVISILPDGSRVYEFHPWERNIAGAGGAKPFITKDVPILDYLERLDGIGEDVSEYQTIWYYY